MLRFTFVLSLNMVWPVWFFREDETEDFEASPCSTLSGNL